MDEKNWLFKVFMKAISDKHFSNIVYLICNIFPAYFTYVKGQRFNKQAVYNGGRKTLLPFFVILAKDYASYILRDIYEMEYRVTDEYRILRKQYFSYYVTAGLIYHYNMNIIVCIILLSFSVHLKVVANVLIY